MIAAIRLWIDKYEILLMVLICCAMLDLGWYAHGIYTEATQATALKTALDAQQTADKIQSTLDLAEAKKNDSNAKKADQLNQDANVIIVKNPMPKCNIGSSRVQLLHRAASRS